MGTTDAQPLRIATNNSERMRVLADGQIVVNSTVPFSGTVFSTFAAGNNNAIAASTDTGYALYGAATGASGNGAAVINTNANGVGLIAAGGGAVLVSLDGTGATITGDGTGGASFSSSGTGTGFSGVGNGSNTSWSLVEGSGLSGTGTKFGVVGFSTETGVNNPNGEYSSAGGYFVNGYDGFAATAVWYDPSGWGGDQNFKIIGTGSVSTIVKDVNEVPVIMYAPEAPESLFQDYGVGELNNGEAIVHLDPILTKNIRVDNEHSMKVFVQLEGDCNGVYVTNKSASSFTVKELQNGKSSVTFSWSIVATRADEVFYNEKGEARISHNNQRFPRAPKPLEIKKIKATKNNPGAVDKTIQSPAQFISKPKNKTN
ncbi:MAG: hypothetical protein ACTIJ9_11450 [Aequorivita sp.]